MALPSATIVIPCFNHGQFVGEAVASCLRQENADVRVVVVDDGSTDGSTPAACEALAGPRVRVIRQDNRGLSAARNRGAKGADTEYLVFLDADDWINFRFVAKLHDAIEKQRAAGTDGDVAYAYCYERLVGQYDGYWRVPDFDPVLMMFSNLHPVTTLIRRDRFDAVGGFDESMREGYEDWDLWLRFIERGWRGVRVPEALFVWRRHSTTTMISSAVPRHEALYAYLMKQHAPLFERHWRELVLASNTLLRRCDMTWLDESREPINLRALKMQREMYESMLAVRGHHAIHRMIARLPGPLARGMKGLLTRAHRLAPGASTPPTTRRAPNASR
jgi:glycosyltransferase involved in cell wall biosynthesis